MVTKDVAAKIADLAKLELTDSEITQYSEQLTAIFNHFEKLSKIDTTKVEPMVTPSPVAPNVREDVVRPGLGGEKSVTNAAEKHGNLFKVPPVVG
jgi:aspartyl-tRNA(Asn)/glutamyl-tRNA(Gln) amidotransferase subunit C